MPPFVREDGVTFSLAWIVRRRRGRAPNPPADEDRRSRLRQDFDLPCELPCLLLQVLPQLHGPPQLPPQVLDLYCWPRQLLFETVAAYGRRTGLDITPHDSRRTYAKLAHQG